MKNPKQLLKINQDQVATANLPIPGQLTDLTVVIMVSPKRPGMLVSKFSSSNNKGFNIKCYPNGDIVVVQRNGNSILSTQTRNSPIDIYDGYRHSIAYSCSGLEREIYIDGESIENVQSGKSPAFDFNTNALLEIGGNDPDSNSNFEGNLFSIGIWQRSLTQGAIKRASFGFLNGLDIGMIAYWQLDGTLIDLSPNKRKLLLDSAIFQPTFHSFWANTPRRVWRMSDNNRVYPDYMMYHINGLANSQSQSSTNISSDHSFFVGTSNILFGALMGRGKNMHAPLDVKITLTDPNGKIYNTDVNNDLAVIKTRNGGIHALTIKSPKRGQWKINVVAPSNADFIFQVQAIPRSNNDEISAAMATSLRPLLLGYDLENQDDSHIRGEVLGFRSLIYSIAAVALVGVAIVLTGPGLLVAGIIIAVVTQIALVSENEAKIHFRQINREDAIKARGQTEDLLRLKEDRKEILLLDPANIRWVNGVAHRDADISYTYRDQFVYPLLDKGAGLKFTKNALLQSHCTKINVQRELAKPNIIYVTACGHGLKHALFGWNKNRDTILEEMITTSISADLVRGKIFHFLACWTGADEPTALGQKLIKLGAIAFIGYKNSYTITDSWLGKFSCKSDAEIDRILIEGGTVKEAVAGAKKMYADRVKGSRNDQPDKSAQLSHNSDLLVWYGNGDARLK